jgi:hypothetical protein
VPLSIPLKKGKNNGMNIKSVKISYDEDWNVQHLKKIRDGYMRSPYYNFYIDELEAILLSSNDYLFDLNQNLFYWIMEKLDANLEITETKKYTHEVEDMTDLRAHKVGSLKMSYKNSYPQVFEHKYGFIPDMSVLDLLMNQGPESLKYLKEMDIE